MIGGWLDSSLPRRQSNKLQIDTRGSPYEITSFRSSYYKIHGRVFWRHANLRMFPINPIAYEKEAVSRPDVKYYGCLTDAGRFLDVN